MRISDWSSDVCSSDLTIEMRPTDDPADLIMHQADIDIRFYGDSYRPSPGGKGLRFVELARPPFLVVANQELAAELSKLQHISDLADGPLLPEEQIGRASCRERGCPYVYIPVVAVSSKKINIKK